MHLSLERIFAPERFCASENETGAGQETPLGHRGDCTRGSVAVCSPKCSAVPDLDAVVVTRPAAAPPQPSPCDIRRSIRARPVVSIDPLATRVRIPQPRACKLIAACKTFFLCLNVSWTCRFRAGLGKMIVFTLTCSQKWLPEKAFSAPASRAILTSSARSSPAVFGLRPPPRLVSTAIKSLTEKSSSPYFDSTSYKQDKTRRLRYV